MPSVRITAPDGSFRLVPIVMHEPGHTHHMHVRFECAPYEKRCKPHPTRSAPEL